MARKKVIKGDLSEKREVLPNIKNLENNILQYIVGQDEPVRQIITSIYRARLFRSIKANILIVGKRGTGKTATINEIAKRLHIPFVVEDATKFTQEGYYGDDVQDMIYDLLVEADFDIEKAKRGIIMIDEIDKKAGNNDIEVSNSAVLKSLLKIIEGTKINLLLSDTMNLVEFDTSNIIFIMSGAFSGLDKIRDKRLNKSLIGFQASRSNLPQNYIKKDFINYGMTEEFMGRIDRIVEMNDLTENDLALILKKSKLSIFRKYQNALREQGIILAYKGELFKSIAKESLSLDTGARELSNTVNYIFERILYEILSNPRKYTKCELFPDIVKDNKKFRLS